MIKMSSGMQKGSGKRPSQPPPPLRLSVDHVLPWEHTRIYIYCNTQDIRKCQSVLQRARSALQKKHALTSEVFKPPPPPVPGAAMGKTWSTHMMVRYDQGIQTPATAVAASPPIITCCTGRHARMQHVLNSGKKSWFIMNTSIWMIACESGIQLKTTCHDGQDDIMLAGHTYTLSPVCCWAPPAAQTSKHLRLLHNILRGTLLVELNTTTRLATMTLVHTNSTHATPVVTEKRKGV
jgi:hypothetical protein